MKYLVIILFLMISTPAHVDASGVTDTIPSDKNKHLPASFISILETDDNRYDNHYVELENIQNLHFAELENIRRTICLDEVLILNPQLSLVLRKTTAGLKEMSQGRKKDSCFYITLMQYEGRLYAEIFEGYRNKYLFDIKNSLFKSMDRDIYGCTEYNDIYIYILLYRGAYAPSKEILDDLMYKTKKKIAIFQNPEPVFQDSNPVYTALTHDPIWLYEYLDGNISLIRSVNDKGFFTNP